MTVIEMATKEIKGYTGMPEVILVMEAKEDARVLAEYICIACFGAMHYRCADCNKLTVSIAQALIDRALNLNVPTRARIKNAEQLLGVTFTFRTGR